MSANFGRYPRRLSGLLLCATAGVICHTFMCQVVPLFIRIIVLNTTFNNISGIPWRSVLFVYETEQPEKTADRHFESHGQPLSHHVVSNTHRLSFIYQQLHKLNRRQQLMCPETFSCLILYRENMAAIDNLYISFAKILEIFAN